MADSVHSYYDWQLSTLLLAYDAVDPLDRDDVASQQKRMEEVEKELYQLAHATLPQWYKDNPSEDFPKEMVVLLTHATLKRASEIVGLLAPAR